MCTLIKISQLDSYRKPIKDSICWKLNWSWKLSEITTKYKRRHFKKKYIFQLSYKTLNNFTYTIWPIMYLNQIHIKNTFLICWINKTEIVSVWNRIFKQKAFECLLLTKLLADAKLPVLVVRNDKKSC